MGRFVINSAIAIAIFSTCAPAQARKPVSNSCAYVSNIAFDNKATCYFMDREHTTVVIIPTSKISTKKAAEWIVDASVALQISGQRKFNSITVITEEGGREYAEAKSTDTKSIHQEPDVIRSLTQICRLPDGWSGVVGLDGKPAEPPKCRPLMKK